MAMSKKQREEQRLMAWIAQHREDIDLIIEAEVKGFDVKAMLRDASKGQVKDREHYRRRKEE